MNGWLIMFCFRPMVSKAFAGPEEKVTLKDNSYEQRIYETPKH